MAHHLFACWNGDRRLEAEHGDDFLAVKERTSTVPGLAILQGRQELPPDYYKELVRARARVRVHCRRYAGQLFGCPDPIPSPNPNPNPNP